MQGQGNYKRVSIWTIITADNQYNITDKELEFLMHAESNGVRLVRFDDFVINVAFIREIKHKSYRKKENQFDKLPQELERFVISSEEKAQALPVPQEQATL